MKGIFRHKRILAIILAVLVVGIGVFIALGGLKPRRQAAPAGTELVLNGDCEEDGEGWLTDAWEKARGYTDFAWTDEGEGLDGSRALYINNHYANDARFWQDIDVSPDCLYRISAQVKAACSGGLGANVSVDGLYVFSNSIYDTAGEWEEAVLYARTGPDQTRFRLFVRLGGYSGEAQGEAYFDDISVTRIESAPAGARVQNIFAADARAGGDEAVPGTASAAIILSCLIYALLAAGLISWVRRRKARGIPDLKPHTAAAAFAVLAAAALAGRILCAVSVRGYDVDVNDFRVWADIAAREGPWGFYQASGFCDYPPGYILVLTLVGLFGRLAGGTTILLVKLPAILADIATAALLYRTALKKTGDGLKAVGLSDLYLFNPLTVLIGSAWGQCDSVMALFLMVTVVCAVDGRWRLALPAYAAAVMLKPQALLFGPLGVLALVMASIDSARKERAGEGNAFRGEILPGLGLMLGVFALVILPFAVGRGGVKWVFDLYGSTMGYYSYATVNSCNLYFLLGLNWAGTDTLLSWGGTAAAAALLCVPMAWVAYTAQGKQAKGAAAGLGLAPLMVLLILRAAGLDTCGYVGAVIIAVSVIAAGAFLSMSGQLEHLPLCGAACLSMIFAGGAMMHERYMFAAAALLLAAYLYEKDKRILILLITVTAAGVLNCGAVLDRNIRIGGSAGHLTAPLFGIESDMSAVEYLSAVLTVLNAAALTALAGERCLCPERLMTFREDAPAERGAALPAGAGWRARAAGENAVGKGFFTRRDAAIALIVSALFACLTFINLGSTKAPQTALTFLDAGESAVLDLGEEKEEFRLLYFQGIHYENSGFTVETAGEDGAYGESVSAAVNYGDCFKWAYVPSYGSTPNTFSGRYVRITADAPGVTLFEVLARTAEGEVYPMTLVTGAEDAGHLCDEPDTLEGEPGWFNSAYFDEIYHARTGYEIMKGDMPIYEWTHPPLGKLMIALCIRVFGMTPFGWRFAGALMGVMMLPAVYLTALLLTRRRSLALGAAGLMFFDFMHFTQTRIATIDSFVVCFILWSVFFMLYWFKLDYWRAPVRKSLMLLGLSGLFMGLAIASKWTGCYCGVGLAVIFFWGVLRRFGEARGARAALGAEDEAKAGEKARAEKAGPAQEEPAPKEESLIGRNGHRRIVLDILSCFIFFILIPLAIYYVSYIPVLRYEGSISVARIIEECGRMYSYHSQPGLGMDHPFYSPWYEWPVIAKPMWFAAAQYLKAGEGMSITVFGNPAVWYLGSASVVIMLVYMVWRFFDGKKEDLTVPVLILICFLAQFLPWVLVPRGTYIYHYFASVPFTIMANVYLWGLLEKRKPRWGVIGLGAQVALAVLMFAAFFPYISGVTAPVEWMEAMQWYPNWLWFSRGA